MILSVSERTDIPALYGEWFSKRIKEGFVYVRNPFNQKQVFKVKITPDVVDGIVFWSKNPRPFFKYMNELKEYTYYFQFTITPYGKDIEPNLPGKKEILESFIELSCKISKERVILRYDPILISNKYSVDFHKKAFERLIERLEKHTEKVVISFLDLYKKVEKNLTSIDIRTPTDEEVYILAEHISKICNQANLKVETCAEKYELERFGIEHGRCIDAYLIEKLSGTKLSIPKIAGHRKFCFCHEYIDIGQYDTCINGCIYCYANVNKKSTFRNYKNHDPNAPILVGNIDEAEVYERKVSSLKQEQMYFKF